MYRQTDSEIITQTNSNRKRHRQMYTQTAKQTDRQKHMHNNTILVLGCGKILVLKLGDDFHW